MSQALPDGAPPVLDLVGVGFGPSNLAMAAALEEHNATAPEISAVTARFLERQPRFGWHRGMLIDDATMQVSFLKDLVTLRNPASRYSFLCYLQSVGRLVDFVNHKSLFPLRIEFHDYFEWAAARLSGQVDYGHAVVGVRPVEREGVVAELEVRSRAADGTETLQRARNLVLAPGLRPRLPDGVEAGERIWHTSELLHRVEKLDPDEPRRFVVVGAGQSAAEAVGLLHRRFPAAEVCAVFSRYGYSPADDSSFANQIFDPDAVDDYFTAPEETKRRLMGYHRNTNYAVVDLDLIDDLYGRVYQEKVLGTERLRMLKASRPVEVQAGPDRVRITVESLVTGETTPLDADAVVYATGYHQPDPLALLGDLADHVLRDAEGRPRVGRDYRLLTGPGVECGLYLQGGTEHTHGITSSLLSNTAIRVGEILDSVLAHRAAAAGRTPTPTPPAQRAAATTS
ncbi:lysine N(6)-hydroxylase/L-ornithine N(5)-oxygenase family protein [Kitasatospora sp. NPDC096147]|uniref:lysine N(6)-hydroxylase/L-ornithine N(5)-oxygenase family protein n=1 Tax=Kitasatospora sp. NPDC096147 TaxID=3364093 RepID=UPI00381C7DDD